MYQHRDVVYCGPEDRVNILINPFTRDYTDIIAVALYPCCGCSCSLVGIKLYLQSLHVLIDIEFYFLLRYPRFTMIVILSMVTQVLIVGYELEVRKVGLQRATSNGQPYYPIYLLAPYRLACVAGGMLVAFIWTFFPYPITARSQLRKDLGASLYLLANFYSCVHTTIGIRFQGAEGDMDLKDSPGRQLEKARGKVFAKELILLARLREHSAFTAWEPTFGGKFPKQQYDEIIEQVQKSGHSFL